jgi:hypothetical protein
MVSYWVQMHSGSRVGKRPRDGCYSPPDGTALEVDTLATAAVSAHSKRAAVVEPDQVAHDVDDDNSGDSSVQLIGTDDGDDDADDDDDDDDDSDDNDDDDDDDDDGVDDGDGDGISDKDDVVRRALTTAGVAYVPFAATGGKPFVDLTALRASDHMLVPESVFTVAACVASDMERITIGHVGNDTALGNKLWRRSLLPAVAVAVSKVRQRITAMCGNTWEMSRCVLLLSPVLQLQQGKPRDALAQLLGLWLYTFADAEAMWLHNNEIHANWPLFCKARIPLALPCIVHVLSWFALDFGRVLCVCGATRALVISVVASRGVAVVR